MGRCAQTSPQQTALFGRQCREQTDTKTHQRLVCLTERVTVKFDSQPSIHQWYVLRPDLRDEHIFLLSNRRISTEEH